jgi:hypothetical protein
MLDIEVGWYLNIRSWLENSQNYFEYSPILIESIFHHNIRVVGKRFRFPGLVNPVIVPTWILSIIIYLGIQAHNKFKKPDLIMSANIYSKP